MGGGGELLLFFSRFNLLIRDIKVRGTDNPRRYCIIIRIDALTVD